MDQFLRSEVIAGDVYAAREFKLIRKEGSWKIGSVMHFSKNAISPGEMRAECYKDSTHEVPEESCTCGFYSFDSKKWYFNDAIYLRPSPGHVKAIVRLSGKIVTHRGGVRAERMEVVALCLHPMEENILSSEYSNTPRFSSIQEMFNSYPIHELPRRKNRYDLARANLHSRLQTKSPQSQLTIEKTKEFLFIGIFFLFTLNILWTFQGEISKTSFLLALFSGALARIFSNGTFESLGRRSYLGMAVFFCIVVPALGISLALVLGASLTFTHYLFLAISLSLSNTYILRNIVRLFRLE